MTAIFRPDRPSASVVAAIALGIGLSATGPAAAQQTLDQIRQRGFLICGASQGNVGFSAPDEKGVWKGLDVDTCRAIAVAIFGDKEKARFVPLSGPQRLTALQTGEIDVLPRTTTWTLRRDAGGLNFSFPNYYEYDGFLLPKKLGVTDTKQMKGASICLQSGSTTEVTVADLSREYKLGLKPILFDNVPATRQAFFSGRCDALISDASALATARATQAKNPDDYAIIPASGHYEALAPSVRHGDDRFYDIVKWSFQALIAAEDLGISQANVDQQLKSENPKIQRFLGAEPGNGQALGIDENWAYNIVKQIGNYGEIFDRNIGKDSPIKLDRGPNKLHKDGGLMFPLVFN